jgi:3-hydroxyacyl-CoA dehydrogenase/3a,7a,12a-trihydroxy-5b-cholest-24-enoyl-CoA hydratase
MQGTTGSWPELVGVALAPTTFAYDDRDAILYALGIGAAMGSGHGDELRFAYENHEDGFRVFPTFATTFAFATLHQLQDVSKASLNPFQILHAEQETILHQRLPEAANLTNEARIAAVYDKGSGALVQIEVVSKDATGAALASNRYGLFIRGAGGFGGERGPAQPSTTIPQLEPDHIVSERIPASQALLYRLSGDRNPLHADPRIAALAGYDRPVLHGLCTFGFAARAGLRAAGRGAVDRFISMRARFTRHVFPGEMLITEIWEETSRTYWLRSRVRERDEVVLAPAILELSA